MGGAVAMNTDVTGAVATDLATIAGCLDKSFVQTADINMQGLTHTPIGSLNSPFTGRYDGDDKTISNLTVTGTNSLGLFGSTRGATISRLMLTIVSVTRAVSVRGLIGLNNSATVVDSFDATANVTDLSTFKTANRAIVTGFAAFNPPMAVWGLRVGNSPFLLRDTVNVPATCPASSDPGASPDDGESASLPPGVAELVVLPVASPTTDAEVLRVDIAAGDAPQDRTEAQVAVIQQAGEQSLNTFIDAAPAGPEPLVTMSKTSPVRVEHVVLVTAAETRVLFSTPTLLGPFSTNNEGTFAGQVMPPADLEAGAHTLVLTASTVTETLGVLADSDGKAVVVDPTATGNVPTPVSDVLPRTGQGSGAPTLVVLVLVAIAAGIVASRRRLLPEVN